MIRRTAENNVNYQERAKAFNPGDIVVPVGLWEGYAGRVTAVYPGIGMVDVEFPTGNRRFPVEELQLMKNPVVQPPETNSAPGGAPSLAKVALYWAEKDRKFKLTRTESGTKSIFCPKCKETTLKKAIYTRVDGCNDHLMGCPNCMFLIRFEDILNHWTWAEG